MNKNNSNTEKEQSQLIQTGKVDDKQLANWKKEHETAGPVKVIELKVSENETSFGYLKPPSRLVIAKAMSMFAEKQLIECGTFILNNCWLGGDERMKTNDKMNVAASTYANGCIEFMEGDLKNA